MSRLSLVAEFDDLVRSRFVLTAGIEAGLCYYITRVAPESSSGSGSGQNMAFFPNLAKIRLRAKFRMSQMLLLVVTNAHK